jgi:hypothetical protein
MHQQVAGSAFFIAAAVVLSGCAGLNQKDTYYFRFAGDRTTRSNAHMIREEAVYTVIEFLTEPEGASVFAYDARDEKKGSFLGKTPFHYNAMAYNITEYADKTSEYDVEVFLPHIVTKSINYANPRNSTGEITFTFLIQKKGYPSIIERVRVAATNEVLVRALVGADIRGYRVEVTFE